MSQLGHTDHLNQGEGGARRSKKSGGHLEQGVEGGAKRGSTGSYLDPNVSGSKTSGSHLEAGPNVPSSDKTSDRGGGTRQGHDRANPVAGKSNAGNKDEAQVRRTNRSARSGTFLGR